MESEKIVMAYLAGVMDGDGSFSIGKITNGSLNPLYFPMLQCNTWRLEFVELLKKTLGGNLVKGKMHICKDGRDGHALTCWKLRSAANCKPALESLIPYLKIKKERAETVLQFINESPFKRGKILENSELVKRERFYLKVINFNDWKGCYTSITTKLAKGMSSNDEFWSYVAGLMDTDGSFSIKKQTQNKGTHVINARYLPVISLSMTDTRAINYLRENCNVGKLYIPKNKSTNSGIHYQYGVYTKLECIEFLKRLIPFLRAKKANAMVLLDFCVNSKNTGYCKAGIPADELAYRESCYQELCHLNKYGVYKSSLMDSKFLPGDAGDNEAEAGQKPGTVNVASEKTPKGDAVL
jgi:hypothetical protein